MEHKKRVIVAGSSKNHISKIGYGWLDKYLELEGIDELVCGLAPCVDSDARRWAVMHKIPVKDFPAQWQNFDLPMVKVKYKGNYKYNALAGLYRNGLMAEYATHAVIFPGRTGTNDMYRRAVKHNLIITDFREYDDLVI